MTLYIKVSNGWPSSCEATASCLAQTFDTFGDRQQNAGNEGLAVVRLLKDLDLLTKTGSTIKSAIGRYQTRLTGSENSSGWAAMMLGIVLIDGGVNQVNSNVRSWLLVGEGLEFDYLDAHDVIWTT